MKLLLMTIIAFTSVLAFNEDCKPRYHFWRPYYGEMPKDAFVAGINKDGTKKYIVKIIPQDKYLRTVPTEIKSSQKSVAWKWKDTELQMVDEFMEILCTDNVNELVWKKVDDKDKILKNCCLVAGGLGMLDAQPKAFTSFVGRAEEDGVTHVGRIYSHNFSGVYVMQNNITVKFTTDYQVLTYDCNNICRP